MNRFRRIASRVLLTLIPLVVLAVFTLPVLAQGGEPGTAPPVDWRQAVALAINSVGVVIAVQLITWAKPSLPSWLKPMLALTAGPLLMLAQTALVSALGYPVDFEPVIRALEGLTSAVPAMVGFAVGKADAKRKLLRAA